MPYSDIYLYSPLSIKTLQEGQNRSLLLQFILSELFHATDAGRKEDPLEFVFATPACFFPHDWSYEVGCLNKIAEHAELLPHAFPKLMDAVQSFRTVLDTILADTIARKKNQEIIPRDEMLETLHQLYCLLEPFLISCRESEELLLFLMKNKEEIDELAYPKAFQALLEKMFPEGLEKLHGLIPNSSINFCKSPDTLTL